MPDEQYHSVRFKYRPVLPFSFSKRDEIAKPFRQLIEKRAEDICEMKFIKTTYGFEDQRLDTVFYTFVVSTQDIDFLILNWSCPQILIERVGPKFNRYLEVTPGMSIDMLTATI